MKYRIQSFFLSTFHPSPMQHCKCVAKTTHCTQESSSSSRRCLCCIRSGCIKHNQQGQGNDGEMGIIRPPPPIGVLRDMFAERSSMVGRSFLANALKESMIDNARGMDSSNGTTFFEAARRSLNKFFEKFE